MHIQELLSVMVEKKASDIHIKVGRPPLLRVNGELAPMEMAALSAAQVDDLARQILTERQLQHASDVEVHRLRRRARVPEEDKPCVARAARVLVLRHGRERARRALRGCSSRERVPAARGALVIAPERLR